MALNTNDTLLNGHYRIQRLLGRGGFGFVYLAQDTLLGENVAIKELIPALVGDEITLRRFLAEAKATMRLTHKRIVRTHNVFQEGTNYYIIMEYMAGGSLEERLRKHGSLSVEEAVRIAAEVCEGLSCAHEDGVVHCDLKPHNILFDATSHAKVADFGIAHVSGEALTRSWMTPAGFVAGTLPYMSPEQADGQRDDPRIDIYALGAVLYRMLTGQTYLDFDQRETPRAQMENLQRLYNHQPVAPSQHNARIPVWLDAIILRALAKQPQERYSSANSLRAALLRQANADSPAAAQSLAPAQRTPMNTDAKLASSRRDKASLPAWFWAAVGAAAILLLVLVIAIGALLGSERGQGTNSAGPTALPTQTLAPTKVPTSSPTDLPPSTSTPTRTPIPPTPTATIGPPVAGASQTRSQDGMKIIYVPAGEGLMGNTEAGLDAFLAKCSECKRESYIDELPQHTVYLDAYWIDQTEVTNAQYARFLNALGSHEGTCLGENCIETSSEDERSRIRQTDGQYSAESGYADHPVINVTWYGSQAYCAWVGGRLPTEAEWERAAAGPDGRTYPWGENTPTCRQAQFNDCDGETVVVGSKNGASPYGVQDMAGNVLEWVADWYDAEYYAASPQRNPQGPSAGKGRVLRGGSYFYNWTVLRTTDRDYGWHDAQYHHVGFRCSVSASPSE